MIRFLGFPDYRVPGQRLAAALGLAYEEIELHRFPDGEHRIRLPMPLDERVIICRSLNSPNAKLVDLMLAAEAAREAGARELALVAPYLCYMRQDTAFHPGEAVSQRIIGRWLAGLFDAVLTVDPHLHRTARLEDAVPASKALALSAAQPLAAHLASRIDARWLLAGPDRESRPWVEAVARRCGVACIVGEKQRRGDRDVSIAFPSSDVAGRPVMLVDDVISTGETLATAACTLRRMGAQTVECLATHCLPEAGGAARLRNAGIRGIHCTDSVCCPEADIRLAPLLAAGLRRLGWSA